MKKLLLFLLNLSFAINCVAFFKLSAPLAEAAQSVSQSNIADSAFQVETSKAVPTGLINFLEQKGILAPLDVALWDHIQAQVPNRNQIAATVGALAIGLASWRTLKYAGKKISLKWAGINDQDALIRWMNGFVQPFTNANKKVSGGLHWSGLFAKFFRLSDPHPNTNLHLLPTNFCNRNIGERQNLRKQFIIDLVNHSGAILNFSSDSSVVLNAKANQEDEQNLIKDIKKEIQEEKKFFDKVIKAYGKDFKDAVIDQLDIGQAEAEVAKLNRWSRWLFGSNKKTALIFVLAQINLNILNFIEKVLQPQDDLTALLVGNSESESKIRKEEVKAESKRRQTIIDKAVEYDQLTQEPSIDENRKAKLLDQLLDQLIAQRLQKKEAEKARLEAEEAERKERV